jgi:hypothetical protein
LHFQLDPPFVYVGGVNVLYQLRSGDLQVVHSGASAIKLVFFATKVGHSFKP